MLFKIFLFEIEFVVAKSEENVEYGDEFKKSEGRVKTEQI